MRERPYRPPRVPMPQFEEMHPEDLPAFDLPPVLPGEMPEMTGSLPQRATVLTVEGNIVTLSADNGEELHIPLESFPYPPSEGQHMVQAEVLSDLGDVLEVKVGKLKNTIRIPKDILGEEFKVGDMFWMPGPPAGPETMEEIPGLR